MNGIKNTLTERYQKLIHDNYFESIYGFKVPIEDRHKTSVQMGYQE